MKYLTRKEELILLAVSRLKDDAYLVNVREHLNKYTGRKWSVGNVYVPLDRMSREGFLESYIGESTDKRGGKAIKYYKLTPGGFKALKEIRDVQVEMWSSFDDLAFEE